MFGDGVLGAGVVSTTTGGLVTLVGGVVGEVTGAGSSQYADVRPQ